MNYIIQIMILIIWTIFLCAFVSGLSYLQGRKDTENFDNIIKDILGEMYIDENGNNVLNGGTEEYETKWKYEIGHNRGLQKAIKILKSYTPSN